LAEAIRQKNLYLRLIAAKITGNSESEVPPLICTPQAPSRAVFLITTPIAFGRLELSRTTYDLLAKHVGMSMNSVSHWAVVVVDRSLGPTYTYDLMSDQLKVQMLMNNYFRVYEASEEFIASWSSCYYVGETLKSHEEIQYLGKTHHSVANVMSANSNQVKASLQQTSGTIFFRITVSTSQRILSESCATAR
jgi:hypothetical protein